MRRTFGYSTPNQLLPTAEVFLEKIHGNVAMCRLDKLCLSKA